MDSKYQSLIMFISILLILIVTQLPNSSALFATHDNNNNNPTNPKPISDLKEAIVKGLGFQADEFKIIGFDLRDALVGKSVAYEFDIEIDNKVMPVKLLEDVNKWEYVDLPIFRTEVENGLVERTREFTDNDDGVPVLAPFELAGPMELWLQDAKDMRISLPHDVDAGVLKKVVLAEGAVVTVKGARSVSLRHPVELPLPLNRTKSGFASGLLTLAERLRLAVTSQNGPILSLRIVGPTSLTTRASSSPSSSNRLKLKRLAPGLVELSSASKKKGIDSDAISPVGLQGEATALITPDQFTTLWPVTSINGSNSNLFGFESLLASVLGPRADKYGSFKLLKADVSAQTYVKIGFAVEKKLKEGTAFEFQGFPDWRTKPRSVRMHFEVLGKIDGNKVIPEKVMQVDPVKAEDAVSPNVLTGNVTMSKMPIVHPPANPFAL